MFFPEKIQSIKLTDRVLEVGPGGLPFERADVFLEKTFDDQEAEQQRGYAKKLKTNKQIVYYAGGRFPFEDNEFDYVICSHVLEHVPKHELDLFISELKRVAPKGYIEFPTAYYELINYQPVHLWLMTYQNQQIRFLDKNLYQSNFIDKTLRELFYSDESNSKAFEKYKDIFFVGFEWNLEIKFKIVTSFADLDDNRLSFWRDKLKSNRSNDLNLTESLVAKKILSKAKSFLKKYKDRFFSSPFKNKKAKVSPKAIVEKKSLVSLGNNAEIQDYVIIKTFTSEVKIGEYSQLNPYTVIYGGVGVSIGNNVMIGPHCMIAAGTHDYIQVDKPMRFAGNLDKGPIIIDDDVWIGANCTISDGVHIGKGAVIGANSVVTKNVNAFDVVAGCPAKKIKNRLEKSRL